MVGRLQERLEKLERGEEVALKDIKALLNPQQIDSMEQAWKQQEQLRKTHTRPKTPQAERAIGWKTKQQVRIDIYRQAIQDAQAGLVDGIHKLQADAEIKAAKVFMSAWSEAVKQGKTRFSAHSVGNIALTRARLRQGQTVTTKRDKEVWAMEEALQKVIDDNMTKEEREQKDLLEQHEKALQRKSR